MPQPFDANPVGSPSLVTRTARRLPWWLLAAASLSSQLAWGQAAAPAASASNATSPARPPVVNSAMDGVLFYQLLVSELELRQGEAGTAYQVMLDAARRSKDEALYRRAVDIALAGRAADSALEALKQWRQQLPRSRQAVELQTQMLMVLGRPKEAREPLTTFIELTPEPGRPAAIASLPRLVSSGAKAAESAQAIEDALKPWRNQAGTRLSVVTTLSSAWLAAGDRTRSLTLAREAHEIDRTDPVPALIALELMKDTPQAEAIVTGQLASPKPSSGVRAAYVRRLTAAQRYGDALQQASRLTETDPAMPAGWLMQGALLIETGEPARARTSLERFLALKQSARPDTAAEMLPDMTDGVDEEDIRNVIRSNDRQELAQAYLMLSQASEQLKDYPAAQRWLDKLAETQPQDMTSIIQRRASILMRQGKLAEARATLQKLPATKPEEVRARYMAEAQLLRDAKEWKAAYDVLGQAGRQFPDDADLLYEQALLAEKLQRYDEMEALLRQVIKIKPDQQHAYNALGYSLAERNIRLSEARSLVERALALTPGDPFITDSLGWIEFRMGRSDEAARLLGQAYQQRPDTEIAAHLGEVLWSLGRQDEARKILRDAFGREKSNDVLNDTLKRLKVKP